MVKRYIIIALGLISGANYVNGMSRLRNLAKPAALGAVALYASYNKKPFIACNPSINSNTSPEIDIDYPKEPEYPVLTSFKGAYDISRTGVAPAKELPTGYTLIIPGITPGFDHVKFAKLKEKHLNAVNKRIAQAALADTDPGKTNSYEEFMQAGLIPQYLCNPSLDTTTCDVARRQLRKCGVNPNNVLISSMSKQSGAIASAACYIDNPKKELFISKHHGLHGDHLKEYGELNGVIFLNKQYFKSVMAHEATHMINNDPLYESKLRNTLKEKRADLVGVFESPNPLARAIAQKDGADHDSIYTHRNSQEWKQLIEDIKACYSPELLAKITKTIQRNGKSYVLYAVEHE